MQKSAPTTVQGVRSKSGMIHHYDDRPTVPRKDAANHAKPLENSFRRLPNW